MSLILLVQRQHSGFWRNKTDYLISVGQPGETAHSWLDKGQESQKAGVKDLGLKVQGKTLEFQCPVSQVGASGLRERGGGGGDGDSRTVTQTAV